VASGFSRRRLLAAAAAAPWLVNLARAAEPARPAEQPKATPIRQGRLKQSVMSSVWGQGNPLTPKERMEVLSRLGFAGVDLPGREELAIMPDYGLVPTLTVANGGATMQDGMVRKELHSKIFDSVHAAVDSAAAMHCPNICLFPGERRGMSHEEGAANTVEILKRVAPYAEEKGVNLCMEITNSKVVADRRTDQMFNDINWGIQVCRTVKSSRVKILYDFYHVQIMNGDVVRTLKDNLDICSHIHVAGVPTRCEIDDTQELNYHYIAREIANMGYQGYVAHEWRPTAGRNQLLSLATCFDILVV